MSVTPVDRLVNALSARSKTSSLGRFSPLKSCLKSKFVIVDNFLKVWIFRRSRVSISLDKGADKIADVDNANNFCM